MNKKVKIMLSLIIILLVVITTVGVGIGIHFWNKKQGNSVITGKKDDWVYTGINEENLLRNLSNPIFTMNSSGTSGMTMDSAISMESSMAAKSDSTLGYSVGGSKNISNFRENIKNGYFPISTDITYNGLFYDY